MRICLVTREYPPLTRHTGGIGRRYSAMAPELARLGHEVHVVMVRDDGGPAEERELDGVQLHVRRRPHPERVWVAGDVQAALGTDRVLRRLGQFDVVLAPEWGATAWAYARRKRRAPLVTNLATSLEQILTLTPGWVPVTQGRVREPIQVRLEREQARRSDGLLACSHAILDWTRELWDLDGKPATVIPNFIDVDRTRELAMGGEPPPGFPDEGPIVLYVGRIERRKGAHTLVEAMNEVWTSHPAAKLVLVGRDTLDGGSMVERLRTIAGENSDRLIAVGDHQDATLMAAISRCDVFALPSAWEAFGVAALEAMALGRPVVVTTGCGFDEFVRDGVNGLMVPPRDAGALAEALDGLLSDPGAARRMGGEALLRADDFTAREMAMRYVDWFEEVARN